MQVVQRRAPSRSALVRAGRGIGVRAHSGRGGSSVDRLPLSVAPPHPRVRFLLEARNRMRDSEARTSRVFAQREIACSFSKGRSEKLMNVDDAASASELAELFGITTQSVARLARDGVIERRGRGKYPLREAFQGYLRHRLDAEAKRNTTSGSAERLRDAKAAEIQQRLSRQERRLIDIEEAEATVDKVAGAFITVLSTLPARITRDVRERQRIEAIIDESRQRMADHFDATAAKLKAGLATSDEEDDD